MAIAAGGKLLTVDSIFGGYTYRNYYLVFFTSLVFYLIAFVWIMIFLNDADAIIEEEVDDRIITINELERSRITNNSSNDRNTQTTEKHFITVLIEVFRPSTITKMVKVVFRHRPQKRKTVLLHLTFGMSLAYMGYLSEAIIGFQFAQKVYHCNSSYYSYINASSMESYVSGTLCGGSLTNYAVNN